MLSWFLLEYGNWYHYVPLFAVLSPPLSMGEPDAGFVVGCLVDMGDHILL